jgi:hypothetical protein
MPTKVSIIEVDLGEDIDNMISEDVIELTQEAKQELDNTIAVAKNVQKLKERKNLEKQESKDNLQKILDTTYNNLIEAGKEGILAENIVESIKPLIKTASAFSLRMKTYLRNKGNEYIMVRKKIDKKPYYVLEPYNKED